MRKILSAVCAASVIAIMSAAGVNAEDTTINVSFGEAVRYDTAIRVPVVVENNIGVQAMSLGISCDSDEVELKAVEDSGLFSDAEFEYNISGNSVIITYTDDTYLYNAEGTLCTLLFTANNIDSIMNIPLTFDGGDTYVVDKCQDRQGCTVISADVKIPQVYTVKYETNGGTEITDKSYTYGTPLLEQAEREDYIFEGWYTDIALTDRFDGIVRSDLSLYAAWMPEDRLIENLTANIYNGILLVDFTVYGTAASDNNKIIVQVNNKDGEILALKTQDLSISARDTQEVNMSFDTSVLETTEADVSVMIWNPLSKASPVTKMKSVEAKNTVLVTLKSDSNSLIGYGYVEVGKTYMPVAPDVAGKTFNGWTNAKGIEWNDSSIVNSDVTLFANYKTNKCTVTLYSETLEIRTIGYGEKLTRPDNIDGCTIEGWYTKDGQKWDFDNDIVTSDTELYAKWEINYYTVMFDTDDANEIVETQYIKNGGSIEKPIDITKPQREFAGWYLDDTNWDFSTDRVYGNMTLRAKWSINQYTVIFETDGGTPVDPITVNADETISQPSTSRQGYRLIGWYTTNNTKWDFTTNTVVENITLHAVWQVNDVTISFNGNGGSTPSNITVIYNSNYGSLPTPSRTGYTFTGWYTASSGGTQVTSATKVTNMNSHTLYARWTVNSYTYNIVYKSTNGTSLGSSTATYNYGTTNTISPRSYSGYNTPSSQSVKWDSTSAKTITFSYSPSGVQNGQCVSSGDWWINNGRVNIWYDTWIEYANRTSNSIQVRMVWYNHIRAGAWYGYAQYYWVNFNGVTPGYNIYITENSTWSSSSSSDRTSNGTSNWVTVSVSPTTTSLPWAADWRDNCGRSGSVSGTFSIPTY